MYKRKEELEKFLKHVKLPDPEIIISKIKEKFPELEKWVYRKPNKVSLGTVITYVDLDLNKVGIGGVVVNITYAPTNDYNKKHIKYIHLKNTSFIKEFNHPMNWKIEPSRYHLFESTGKKNIIDKIGMKYLLDEINTYKQKINTDT